MLEKAPICYALIFYLKINRPPCTLCVTHRLPMLSEKILPKKAIMLGQWRSEGIWRPGANLNFAPPPPQKNS